MSSLRQKGNSFKGEKYETKVIGNDSIFFLKKSENLEVGPKNINFLHYLKNGHNPG